MKILLIGALAASALAISLPAAAQVRPSDRAARLESAIDAGLSYGSLSSADARNMRSQLRSVERLDQRYQAGGLTSTEARDLDRRYGALADEVNVLDAD